MSTIKIYWLNWVVVLRPTTDLSSDTEIEELLEAFKSSWAECYQGIVINLSDVHRLSSTAFGALVDCHRLARGTHTRIAICCVNPRILRILDLAGLGSFLNRFESEADAIRYCRER